MSIQVINVTKNYSSQKALDAVSFTIDKGEVVGLLGPNGAGKSTLMKILTGFIASFDGEVLIDSDSVQEDLVSIQKNIGYLPESNPLYEEMYVLEYLSFIADIHQVNKASILKSIERVGLTLEGSKKIKELSKGYKQRVGFAAALLHDPHILILDEPTTGLDPNQLTEIRELIRDLGKDKLVLLSTHIMQEVDAVCSRVLILKEGKIVADKNLNDLKEQQAQVIEVEFDYQIEQRLFSAISNLRNSDSLGGNVWRLTFDTKKDMRSEIFDFSNQNGLKIIQLSEKNKNLESLFQELTN